MSWCRRSSDRVPQQPRSATRPGLRCTCNSDDLRMEKLYRIGIIVLGLVLLPHHAAALNDAVAVPLPLAQAPQPRNASGIKRAVFARAVASREVRHGFRIRGEGTDAGHGSRAAGPGARR